METGSADRDGPDRSGKPSTGASEERPVDLPLENPRRPEAKVERLFVDRWSPRAFHEEPLSETQIATLFEAARWAPSCYNDQPWFFIYARTPEDRRRFVGLLTPGNQEWAQRAPLLCFLLARRHFAHNNKPNRHCTFDAGAAWASLAFQARFLGLYAHGMAGFDRERAYDVLGVPDADYDILAAIAVGRRAPADTLPPAIAKNERPNRRKAPAEVAREGGFSSA